MPDPSEPLGRIVRTEKDGQPILWTYVPELLPEEDRLCCPWLAILSWHYDGSSNNGMPDPDTNQGMVALDLALETIESPKFCSEAYRRVGNGLREFVFYIASRDDFLKALNDRLASHPRYPIEITFYEDSSWSDLQSLIDDFSEA